MRRFAILVMLALEFAICGCANDTSVYDDEYVH